MGASPRQSRWMACALGVAVAGAALIGFLISRPRTPLTTVVPTPLTNLVAPTGPSVTAGYSVADDVATQQIVVFGGIADNQATWLWNGSRWSLADPATSPGGRIDAAAAYDPALHLVLLFGGHGPPGTDLSDTWAWGGANWRELDAGTQTPPPSDAVMAWDAGLSQMVLVAGEATGASTGTWLWSGTRWTRVASALPFPPSTVSLGFDPLRRQLLAAAAPSSDTTAGASTQTWAWNGAVWTNVSVRNAPAVRSVQGLGLDPPSGHLFLFSTPLASTNQLETWEWDGAGWREPSLTDDTILSGVIVSTDTSLLLVGALDTGGTLPAPVKVWSWQGDAWTAT